MKFFIKGYGCASNMADTNFMKQILLDNGFVESNIEDADFAIINTCAVKGPTENKIKAFINKINLPKKNIIIIGCLVSDKKFIKKYNDYNLINPYNTDKILDVINFVLKNNKPIHFIEQTKLDKTKLYYKTKNIAIVQPLIGCLGNCYYCKTKIAKPIFYSYPIENILQRIEFYIKQGVKEIWISSEDNAAYGKDIGLTYIDLLNEIESRFAGKAMFRFGMSNPWLLLEHLKELITFFKNTKAFFKFLHIPIQSGSTDVLKNMNRPYDEKDLELLFSTIRKNFSFQELTLATDIIVGYPDENEKDFNKTLNILEKYDFLIVNISQFWPRPFTKAVKFKQLPNDLKKKRSILATNKYKELSKKLLREFVNKKLDVWFDKIDITNKYLGRTKNYVSVISSKKQEFFNWNEETITKFENNHLVI